jgi:hypothetical protein
MRIDWGRRMLAFIYVFLFLSAQSLTYEIDADMLPHISIIDSLCKGL